MNEVITYHLNPFKLRDIYRRKKKIAKKIEKKNKNRLKV